MLKNITILVLGVFLIIACENSSVNPDNGIHEEGMTSKLCRVDEKDQSGEIYHVKAIEYNDNGDTLKVVHTYTSSPQRSTITMYAYDSYNRLIGQTIMQGVEATPYREIVWSYSDGILQQRTETEQVESSSLGYSTIIDVYTYDDKENVILQERFFDDTAVVHHRWKFTYEYSSRICMEETDMGADGVIDAKQIKYYGDNWQLLNVREIRSDDTVLTEQYSYTDDGKILTEVSERAVAYSRMFEYNSSGLVIHEDFNSDYSYQNYDVYYEYDTSGNLVTKRVKTNQGSESICSYRYNCESN